MLRKNLKKGFSLVELLVVITIIAILSVVAYTAVGGQTVKAKNSRRLSDTNTIQQALELYFVKNGSYPVNLADMGKDIVSRIPTDPGGDSYEYRRGDAIGTGSSKTYVLVATMESEIDDSLSTYWVGNDDDFIFPGFTGTGCGGTTITHASNETIANCSLYDPTD